MIAVGTSGFSFPGWVGPFYPPGTRPREMLERYAEAFPALELNATFYRPLPERAVRSLERRTPPGFEVVAKAPGEATHLGRIEALAPFVGGLDPLRASGKLAAILLQFPARFRRSPGNRRLIEDLAGRLDGIPLVVEFRHVSWAVPATFAWLSGEGLSHACVVLPPLPYLYPPVIPATGEIGYLRLHSLSARNWLLPGRRYDYSFSDPDLAVVIGRARDLLRAVRRVFVFFNNCGRGEAARNAARLRELLRERGLPVLLPSPSAARERTPGLFPRPCGHPG